MKQHSVLGRGLGSLIPQRQTITEQVIPSAKREVLELPVDLIKENPRQPRTYFSPIHLEDLISSIREHGILQPLVVTRQNGDYELIAGERRLRACRSLGLETVPVIVRDVTEQQKLELALIENIQRQDLNAIEEALAYRALIDEFNLTQEEVSKRVGKQRSTIANILRLLELEDEILLALKEEKISKSLARTLLAEPDSNKRMILFKKMLLGNLSVREAEARVGKAGSRKIANQKDPNISAHENTLREILGTKVTIQDSKGKGKIIINYYSRQEFLDFVDRLSD